MLKNSTRENIEKLAFLAIGSLFFLYISGILLIGTKLEFDRNTAQFRETKLFLRIPYRSSIRDTWPTQFEPESKPMWEVVRIAGSTSPSVWHGVAGRFNADIQALGYLDESNRLSESSKLAIVNDLKEVLRQNGDIQDNLLNATAWFDCFLWDLPIPDDTNELIPDEAVLELLMRCKAELQD